MEQVLFGGGWFELNTGVTTYNLVIGAGTWNTTESKAREVIPTDGYIKNLRVKVRVPPGGGKSWDFTLYLNGNPTALTVHIHDNDTTGSDLVNEIDVAPGDEVSLECDPTDTPATGYASWTTMFEGDTANESIIMGSGIGGIFDKGNDRYGSLMGRYTGVATDAGANSPCPTAGIIKNLYVSLTEDPGTAPDAFRFTTMLNGAAVGESSIVTITAEAKTGNDQAHNLDIAAGDTLSMFIEPLNAPANHVNGRWGMVFLADTDGESVILAGSTNDLHATATEYNALQCGSASWISAASEDAAASLGQACTLKNLYMRITTAPGDGKSYVFNVRNPAGTPGNLTVTITGAGTTTGNDTGNTDVVGDGTLVALECNPDGTPNAADAFWGLVGYIEPAAVGWAGGDVLGVDIATVAKINGVELANIIKVNGVA